MSASAKMEVRIGPKQTRPRISTCGSCGSEVAKGTLVCEECRSDAYAMNARVVYVVNDLGSDRGD